MNNTFYFSHDYNSRNDPKIIKLRMKHGMEGVGIFWSILEMLYEQGGELTTDYDVYAFALQSHCDIIKSVVEDFNLFIIENGKFYSIGASRRLEESSAKSEKARQSAEKRWNKSTNDANAMRTHTDRNAINEMKLNEIKEKEREEEKKENALSSRIFKKTNNSKIVETITVELIRYLGKEVERLDRFLNWYDVQNKAWTAGSLQNLSFKIKDWIRFDEPIPESDFYKKPPSKSQVNELRHPEGTYDIEPMRV